MLIVKTNLRKSEGPKEFFLRNIILFLTPFVQFQLLCSAFFAQYNIGRFFLPFSPEKKIIWKSNLKKRRRAILHRFYKECNKSFSCCSLTKQDRKCIVPVRKPSLEHENKQFMTPIQLVIILLERQALLLLYSIFLGQSKDIKEKTSLDNFLVFVFHRLLVLSKVLRVKVN